MKRNIFKGLLVCGVAVAMAGCSENTWNEDNLDGFEVPSLNTPKRTYIDYTLTSSDYSKLSKLKANRQKAEAAGVLSQLDAVGSNGYFSDVVTARDYIPAWLDSVANTTGSVFKSALVNTTARISYETVADMPVPVTGINGALEFEVSTDDYIAVYSPDELDPEKADYAEAFSPGHPASKYVPQLLKSEFPNATAGEYAYVTYNESLTNPVFGGSTGGDEPEKFELSDVLGSMVKNSPIDANVYVSAICAQGLMVTDKSGTCLAYTGKNFDATPWKVGQQLNLTGKGGSYNGGLQVGSPVYGDVVGTQAVNTVAEEMDAAKWDALTKTYADAKTAGNGILAKYVKVNATIKIDGNYVNFTVAGAENGGGLYQPTQAQKNACADGASVVIEGWALSRGWSNTLNLQLLNIIPVYIDGKAVCEIAEVKKAAAKASRAVADLASTKVNAVYEYNGSAWTVPADVYVLTATDYKQMGVTTLNADQAKKYLPMLFAKEYPYAADGDVKYAVYNNHKCDQLVYNGTEWTINTMTTMSQFVRTKDMSWIYDPTVYVTFETGKSGNFTDENSGKFWKGCVEWVWKNKCVEGLGLDASLWDNWGASDVFTTHGYCWGRGAATQEGYSGASAWYGNLDTKLSTVKKNITEEELNAYFGDVATDANKDQFSELLQKHFAEEVAAGALGMVFPDAKPGTDGIDQEYEISITQYNPSSHQVAIRYRVVAPGKFQFVECESWGLKAE
ncbi:hypothetical protein [uncultured Muribaculum sp.]|uniref:hypothetical protein n=1 Tax=uncultured Muribaculum sp. TaxID=1918613 RepID=UPI0025E92E24|nr:hypothetical protein [uncultured Muribaculum sp.]